MPKLYATVDAVRQASAIVQNYQPNTNYDLTSILEDLIEDISREIDRYCKRPDGFIDDDTASAREFPGQGGIYQIIDECTAITTVEVKPSITSEYTTWLASEYIPIYGGPDNPDYNPLSSANPRPYNGLLVAPSTGKDFTYGGGGGDGVHHNNWALSKYAFPRRPPQYANSPRYNTVRVTATWGYATSVPRPIKRATIIEAVRILRRGQGGYTNRMGTADTGYIEYDGALDNKTKSILNTFRRITW